MEAVKLPSSNIILAAPQGMENKVNPIDATRYVLKDENTGANVPGYMVGFKLDDEELKKVVETGMVYIHVMGELFPPILPTVYTMEETFGDQIVQGGEE